MRILKLAITISFSVCALSSGAQTLTATYIELADSADRYISQKRWDDAERVIVKALKHEPANKSNYLLWSNLGTVRTNLGDYNGALQAFDIGLASAPNSTMLLSNRARAYLALGKKADALSDLNSALRLDSLLEWPLKMRGLLLLSERDANGSKRDLSSYLEHYKEDVSVLEALGECSLLTGDGEEAIGYYDRAYRLEPDEELLAKKLSAAYTCGKLDEYSDELVEGIRKYPRCGPLYVLRGLWHKEHFQNEAMEQDIILARQCGVDKAAIERLLGRKPAE